MPDVQCPRCKGAAMIVVEGYPLADGRDRLRCCPACSATGTISAEKDSRWSYVALCRLEEDLGL